MPKLTLVSLPIGNKDDITIRALKALETGQYFIAEDTRSFKDFLRILGLPLDGKTIVSFHDQSNEGERESLLRKITEWENVYLVSEAGSPMISDPAYPLVREALERGMEVDTFSGISSVIAALELSGLPPHPFSFHGFFPREKNKQDEVMERMEREGGTHLYFDSPERVKDNLARLCQTLPTSQVSLLREISKKFQTAYRFKALDFATQEIFEKGECVVVVYLSKSKRSEGISEEILALAQEVLDSGGSTKPLSKLLGHLLQQDKKGIYKKLSED